MDEEQCVLSHSSVGRQSLGCHEIQGQGKLGLTKFPVCLRNLFPSQLHLCPDPEGRGDGDAVFSVWGKKGRSIIWSESLLIPSSFSTMIIPSKALASVVCQIPAGSCTHINPLA